MMDQSFSDSDNTISPSQILERLHVLRQLQILQRSKLQKQMNFQNSPDISKSITEIVSHFSDSTSYNTFRSLLQSPRESGTEQIVESSKSHRENLGDIVDGVTFLNLSQESEYINASPSSTQSNVQSKSMSKENTELRPVVPTNQISLDEMPILSPKKDFEALLLEKIKKEEKTLTSTDTNISKLVPKTAGVSEKVKLVNKKKPFLKRGEGMARFGINKNNLIIQNTKSLPWKKSDNIKCNSEPRIKKNNKSDEHDMKLQVLEDDTKKEIEPNIVSNNAKKNELLQLNYTNRSHSYEPVQELNEPCIEGQCEKVEPNSQISHTKIHPLLKCKGKTWASVLSKEQNDLLTKLKQSDYYKNFLSPAKSIISDISCDDNISKLTHEKEVAEQNLFELIENKVSHDSFHFENSFFNRFLGKTALESSGESTPLMLKRTITSNPKLMTIAPSISVEHHGKEDTCDCEDCSDICSSISCCCSCKTVTDKDSIIKHDNREPNTVKNNPDTKNDKTNAQNECHNAVVVSNEVSANMAEMNAKLIATSELLKERLKELEDEIETFRKENINLTKMREEIEQEKHTFFQEKQDYEKKFNEEKILSEYYIAEEKEKLQKQKQMYERYVRDMRGRLNKKEKDEVVNLKKEIQDLKEEIRLKDARSTSALARLRNQIKIMEKEKKNNLEEIDKLKKENQRIQHSNDITRRLTNIKYLEQINKKLHNMTTKDSQVEIALDSDIKYKAHAIERQSRSKNVQQNCKTTRRPRAKSVPNLKVTSRYAKYFSQKDSISDMEKYKVINCKNYTNNNNYSDEDIENFENKDDESDNSKNSSVDDENNLEKLYNERFKTSLSSKNTQILSSPDAREQIDEQKSQQISNYFINKNTKDYNNGHSKHELKSSHSEHIHPQKSPTFGNNSKSPTFYADYSTSSRTLTNNFGNISYFNDNENCTDIRTNRGVNNAPPFANRTSAVDQVSKFSNRMTPSPEPTTSNTRLSRTELNPTEITKPDGTRELRFPNGNVKVISADGKYSKFIYYNGDIKENFYNEGRIKYFYAENKTVHTTHADGLEVLEFPDGQTEKRYKDGSSEIKLPNGSIRYFDPKNTHVREEWRFPDGVTLTVSANGEQRIVFPNGQIEVHTRDHKRREFPDGTVKLIYIDGTSETRYSSGRVRIKDKHGNLIMDSAPG